MLQKLNTLDPEYQKYLLETLAAHLSEAGQYERLRKLFENHDWMHARFYNGGYIYDGYIEDLTLIWEQQIQLTTIKQIEVGKEPTGIVDCFRYALIRTSINSLSGNYSPQLVARAVETQVWSVQKALSTAANVPDNAQRANTYVALMNTGRLDEKQFMDAQHQVIEMAFAPSETQLIVSSLPMIALSDMLDSVFVEQRETILAQALQVAFDFPRKDHSENSPFALALGAIAKNLEWEQKLKILSTAFDAVKALDNDYYRVPILEILFCQLDDSLLEDAVEYIFSSIEYEGDRVRLIQAVADRISGDLLDDTLRRIADFRSHRLYIIALTHLIPQMNAAHQAEVIESTLEMALAIEEPDDCAEVLSTLVSLIEGDRKEELLQKAWQLSGNIEHLDIRVLSLVKLMKQADGEKKRLLLHEILKVVFKIEDKSDRFRFLTEIAPELNSEMVEDAIAFSRVFTDKSYLAIALATLAGNLEGQQKELTVQAALDTMMALSDNGQIIKVLAVLGRHLSPMLAKRVLDLAMGFKQESERATAIAAIALNLGQEDIVRAINVASQMRFDGYRVDVLKALAPCMSNKQLKQIVETSLRIKDNKYRAEALVSLLPYLTKERREKPQQRALTAALEVNDDRYKSELLVALAPYLTGSQLERGLRSARGIKTPENRSVALAGFAQHTSQSSRLVLQDEALDAVLKLEDDLVFVGTICEIAPILDSNGAKKALHRTLSSIETDWYYAPVLSALAPKLDHGDLTMVVDVAQSIKSPIARARTLAQLYQIEEISRQQVLLSDIRRSILEHIHSLQNDSRQRVFAFFAEKSIWEAGIFSYNLVTPTIKTIIEIQNDWAWP